MGTFFQAGWADSSVSPSVTPSPANYWDVIDRAIGGYLSIKTAESQAKAQERLVNAQTQQALMFASVPQLQNPDANIVPLNAWAGGGGGGMPAAPAGGDVGGLLLLGGLALAAVYLLA